MSESPLERLRRMKEEERRAAVPADAKDSARTARRGGIGAVLIAGLVFLLTKAKLLLGALKLGPLLTTVTTMAVSAWAFAAYYGAALAIGIVITILIHELGHGAAAKAMGLKVGAPVFLPLFGAVIALKEQPRSTWVEAVVGYGGPLAGTFAGLAAWALAASRSPEGGELLYVIAWFTFLINLFNLMPVFGLDGDRVSRAFFPWHWIPGGAALVAALAIEAEWTGRVNPFVLFVLVLGVARAGAAWWKSRRGEERPGRLVDRLQKTERYVAEDEVTPGRRHLAAAAYFGLAFALPLLGALAHRGTPVLG